MNTISDVIFKPLTESIYLKLYEIHYTHNSRKRTRDVLSSHDCVVITIFNISRNVFVFVKQFRPPMYYSIIQEEDFRLHCEIDTEKYPPENGYTIEACAGIVDKQLPLVQIAREEVLEECGYDVPLDGLQKIGSYHASPTLSGNLLTLYYCEVTDNMKVSDGGGVEDEVIEIVEMTVNEIREYVTQCHIRSPSSLLFGIYWFFYHKMKK